MAWPGPLPTMETRYNPHSSLRLSICSGEKVQGSGRPIYHGACVMAASVEYLFCQFEPSCICFFGSVVLFFFFLSSIFFVFSWDADCSFFFIFFLMISGMFLCTRLFECELPVSVWFSIYLFSHFFMPCWGSASRFCPANIARFEAEVV